MKKSRLTGPAYFRKALGILMQSAPWQFVAQSVLIIMQGFLPLAMIWLMKMIIDTSSKIITEGVDANAEVMLFVLLSSLIYFLHTSSNSLQQLLKETINQKVSDRLTNMIHQKSVSLDLSYFENSEYHDMYHRAVSDSMYRPAILANNMLLFLQSTVSLVFVAGFLFIFHWSIPVLIISASLPVVFIRFRLSVRMYRWKYENAEEERKAAYFNRILTGKPFAKEVRLFNLGKYFSDAFVTKRTKLRSERIGILRSRFLMELPANLIIAGMVFACYAFVITQTIGKQLSIGDLVLFFFLFQRGLIFLRDFVNSFSGIFEDNLFLANILGFLQLEPVMKEPENPAPYPAKLTKGIEFQDVSFAYPYSKRQTLKNLNLNISAGDTIALVGENGAGKTTLIKLLCRLYEPNSGGIFIDGKDIREYSSSDLRHGISVIFQDFILYNTTAAENIWFGDVDKQMDEKKIMAAAHQAGIADVISGLPDGYHTMLGNLFGQSEELSIGEWQKLALSRAFYRNSDIIILDEPTSSMDPQAEYNVFKTFRELTKGKTCIIISHRFSTVKMADYIFVLDRGNITEHGTHTDLMEINGKYAYLYDLQAINYR
ncbi:MAG: ABC transporter ATP-binding protein/permease [Bacteroidetes bacterium]|nr:ABC transporter ATP-binding protein/permease [Bacteroidota bacterium]